MKAESGGVMTIVDIAKAFDTILHATLGQGLQRKGIPNRVANYVNKMYKGCQTKIKQKMGKE